MMSENDYFDVSPQQRRRKEIDQLYRDKFFSTNPCSEVELPGKLTSNCVTGTFSSNIFNSNTTQKGTHMITNSTKRIIVTLSSSDKYNDVLLDLPFSQATFDFIEQIQFVTVGKAYGSIDSDGVRKSSGKKRVTIIDRHEILPSLEEQQRIDTLEEKKRNEEIALCEARLEELRGNK
jgi:hypothetical protein